MAIGPVMHNMTEGLGTRIELVYMMESESQEMNAGLQKCVRREQAARALKEPILDCPRM